MGGYIGSVRFFKNLILLAVIIMIAVPTCFAIHYRGQVKELNATIEEGIYVENEGQSSIDGVYIEFDKPSYEELYPDFYAPGAGENESGSQEDADLENTDPEDLIGDAAEPSKVIYLTFDDGPSANTVSILDTLGKYNVKATFFVIGQYAENNPETLLAIYNAGHTIGMHSYSHDYNYMYSSVEAFLDEFYKSYTAIKNITGKAPTVFRFPGGSINAYNRGIYMDIMSEMIRRGFIPYDWNVSSQDASKTKLPADTIINNVLSGTANKSRSVVLMHDASGKDTTAWSVGPIVDHLSQEGYAFRAITPDVKPVLFGYPSV